MFLSNEIKGDIYRIKGKVDFSCFLSCMKSKGFRFLFFFRKLKETKKTNPLWLFYKLMYRHYFVKYGIQIPIGVQIGAGLSLPHFGSIVINSKSKIGNNCNILQNVTLGNTKRGQKKGAPIIGNQVYIGPSASIVGGIVIGNNVLIAANAFVNFDVPDNSIVIGNPAKIIPRENAVEGYIYNFLGEF